MRQFSIADITLSWPRLTWPALAWRHAGPWRRKISATSSLARSNSAARQAGARYEIRPLHFTFRNGGPAETELLAIETEAENAAGSER